MPRKRMNSSKTKSARRRQRPINSQNTDLIDSSTFPTPRQFRHTSLVELSQLSVRSTSKEKQESPATWTNGTFSSNYHPWREDYQQILTRKNHLKPMTKDSYIPVAQLVSHAIESVITDHECDPLLSSVTAVKIETVKIKRPCRLSRPMIVRHLRRNELMPSERSRLLSISQGTDSLPRSHGNQPSISMTSTSSPPVSSTNDQLPNQPRAPNQTSVIRRPLRRLTLNFSQLTITPLTIPN